jgi:hypothetical protein
MDILNEMGLTLPWLLGLAILTATQVILFRVFRSGQERNLTRLVHLMEARIRRSAELEKTQLESRFQALGTEQKEAFERLRAELAEHELRFRTRVDAPSSGIGNRLEKRHQVLALARMGMDSRDISRKLRLSRGETELLLGLREDLVGIGTERG